MIRAWQWALVASMAHLLLACPLRKQSAADAGSEGEQDAAPKSESVAFEAGQVPAPPALASAEPTHKHAGSHCAGGEVAILLQPGDEACVIECKSNAGCPAGWACDGEGVLSHNGRPGNAIEFCRIASRGGGTDGGLPHAAAVDAGQATRPAHPEAGTPAKKVEVK